MDSSATIELFRSMMLTGIIVIGPTLIVSFIVAIGVGVIQAVMQIQEQTLSFLPKLFAMFFVLYWTMPWMFELMITNVRDYFQTIPTLL